MLFVDRCLRLFDFGPYCPPYYVIIYYTYVYISTELLNAQEVYDFVEKIELDLFHGETCTESVDNGFATAFGKINFGAEAEAFLGNENGGVVLAFLEDTEGAVIFEFVEMIAFAKTVTGEGVGNLARRTEGGGKNGDNTKDDKN